MTRHDAERKRKIMDVIAATIRARGYPPSVREIAKAVGRPGAARAVGMANHDNPIAVVIPCHRVVGRDGSLTGYAGGLHLKAKLLSIESQHRTLFT